MIRHRMTLITIFCLFLLPVFIVSIMAVAPGWRYPHIIPETFDDRAIIYVTDHSLDLLKHLSSSFIYAMTTACLTLLFCLTPAMVFARNEFKYKSLLESLLMVPALVPYMTFSMGIHFMFIKLGLTDSFIGVVLILSVYSYPYMLRALITGFTALGEDYYICAKNLGATPLHLLLYIELPLILPSVIAGGTIVFLVAFSEYFLVFLIGGGVVASYSGYLFSYLNSSDWAVASILTLLFLIFPIILFGLLDIIILRWYRKRHIIS